MYFIFSKDTIIFFFKFLFLFSKFYFVHSSIHFQNISSLLRFIYLFPSFSSLSGICFVHLKNERLKNVSCICLYEMEKYFKNFFLHRAKEFYEFLIIRLKISYSWSLFAKITKSLLYNAKKFCYEILFLCKYLKIFVRVCTGLNYSFLKFFQKRIWAIFSKCLLTDKYVWYFHEFYLCWWTKKENEER